MIITHTNKTFSSSTGNSLTVSSEPFKIVWTLLLSLINSASQILQQQLLLTGIITGGLPNTLTLKISYMNMAEKV